MAGRLGEAPQVFPKPVVGIPKRIIERRLFHVILGSVMLLPAVAALVLTRIIPTIHLLFISVQEYQPAEGRFDMVGFANYQALNVHPFFHSTLTFGMILAGIRVFLVILPPLLMALGAASMGRKGRRIVVVGSMVPWAVYSPAMIGLTWIFLMNPAFGYATDFLNLSHPTQAPWVILLMDGLSFLGLSIGVSSSAFLAALKGAAEGYRKKLAVRSVLVLGAVMVLAAVALSLQSFGSVHLLNLGGFGPSIYTLMEFIFEHSIVLSQPGLAAAVSVELLIPMALAGILTTVLIIVSNLRILSLPLAAKPIHLSSGIKTLSLVLIVIPLAGWVISLIPCFLKLSPILNMPGRGVLTEIQHTLSGLDFGTSLVNTWVGPFAFVLLVQTPVTFFAALSIGVFRPLGNASDGLLFLFAPWLLVSENLLSPGMFQWITALNLDQNIAALSFPHMINLPMLFILCLLFKGQRIDLTQCDRIPGIIDTFIKPSLPFLAFGSFISYLIIQQGLMWPLMIFNNPVATTVPVLYAQLLTDPYRSLQGIGGMMLLLRVPASLLLLIILGGCQYFIAPRLGIRSGRVIF